MPKHKNQRPRAVLTGADLKARVVCARNEGRFQQALEWIKSMYEKRADYPIDYKPPVPQPRVVNPAPIESEPGVPAQPGER